MYADGVSQQVKTVKDRIADAEHEKADPDADGVGPTRMSEEEWKKLTPAEQVARLGYGVKKLAFKGVLHPFIWHCNKCSKVNVPSSTSCQSCGADQKEEAWCCLRRTMRPL